MPDRLAGASGGKAADEPGLIDAGLAREQALAGQLTLVDIRTPREWSETGIGDVAHPLDVSAPGFPEALAALAADAGDRPVALICRSGTRSGKARAALAALGAAVADVPEGMQGWIARGLPLRRPDEPRRG
jgi:rhodanese-related sulfurtransferase